MIRKENCVYLGSISKPHGTKGSVLLWLKDIKAEEIKERNTVFVEIDGLLVPFFIQLFQVSTPETIILSFEGILNATEAKSFAGCQVYVESRQIKKKRKSLHELPSLRGYQVNDIHKGFVGVAGEIDDIVNNPLLQVIQSDKVFLIPYHEDIILEIDDLLKKIIIEMPEGLMEI